MKVIMGLCPGSRLNLYIAIDPTNNESFIKRITVVYQEDGSFLEEVPYGRMEEGRRYQWNDFGETKNEAISEHLSNLRVHKEYLEHRIAFWKEQYPSE